MPTASQALDLLVNLPGPSSVHFLVSDVETRTDLMRFLVGEGTHRMRDLWKVEGITPSDPKLGTDRFELHKFVSEPAKNGLYTLVVDFDHWTPDALENLYRFLIWAKDSEEWEGLTILAMGPSHPWYLPDHKRWTPEITVNL